MRHIVCAALLSLGVGLAADVKTDKAPEIPLWAHGAPGSEGQTAKETLEGPNKEHDYLKLASIHNPSLTVYLPPAAKATGAAVIIAPGGAHQFLAIDIEGWNVAKYFNSVGVAAFVLKYRLAREPNSPYKVEVHALADAARAIRMVRSKAAEWRVNPSRVGIMGFSAGGEVAALAETRYDAGKSDAADPIDRLSSRPDYAVLVYPGAKPETIKITKDTPPTFMVVADDDIPASRNVAGLYTAFKEAGVPAEVHVFAHGGHGFGIREHPLKPNPVATTWYLRLSEWMADNGWLRK